MANFQSRVREPGASSKRSVLFGGAAVAAIIVLAGCASTHPAPIVHRAPPVRAEVPVFTAPAATAGVSTPPGTVAAGSAATGSAAGATPADSTAGAAAVQTVPIPRSSVEARPLPGAGGAVAAGVGGTAASAIDGAAAPGVGGSFTPVQPNLLKTEPKVVKQPYSDTAFAQMKSAASASDAPAPVALAPATAPATAQPGASGAAAAASASAPTTTTASAKRPATPAASTGNFVWPIDGEVVQGYAQPSSLGMLIAGKPGDPIVAVSDGRVIFSGPGPRTYGNLVIVKHSDETMSVYGNNRTLLVKEGQSVKRGQRIAELGSSGSAAPQLRFEIRKDGKPVDPGKYLPAR